MSNLITKSKFVSGFVGTAVAVFMILGVVALPQSASAALTQSQVAAIVSLLQSFGADQTTINNVQASLTGGTPTGGTGTGTGTGTGYVFSTNLQQGSTGNDVLQLQKALNSLSCCKVSATGAGSPGSESTYFGAATKAAVVKFQNAYASDVLTPSGLTAGTGYFGPASRAKMNALMASSGGTTTPPPSTTGGALTVSSAVQPVNGLALPSAARVPFTKFTVTAGSSDVTITGVNVMRTGPAVDGNFLGVVLLDENGQQIGIAKTLGSLHTALVGESTVVRAGTSRTFTIGGNMDTLANQAARAGQVAALSVTGIQTAGGATVSGVSEASPITGAYHTISGTLTIGSAAMAVDSLDPDSTSISKEIGTTGYTFAAVRLTAGSAEDVRLDSIRWNQSGSVGSSDLANLVTVVDGTSYGTTVSADGKYFTTIFPGGLTIAKGLQKTISIKGDIVGGPNRTVEFDIYKATDVYVTGVTYGAGLTPTQSESASASAGSEFTSGTPFFSGSSISVTAGSATTINKATSGDGAAQNIAVNVPNVNLGGFTTDMKGEPISVQTTVFWFQVSGSGGDINDIDNVSLYKSDGTVVAGPQDVASTGKVTFTDTITFPVGPATYYLKGKLGTDFTNNQTITASTTPSSDWTTITGQTTGNTITLTNGLVTMNAMTVKAATTTLSVSSSPAAQNIVMGQTGFTFMNVQYDASASGEDVRFNSASYNILTDTGGSYPANCFAYDGSTRLNSTAVTPSTDGAKTFTFDTPLNVTKGTVKNVTLKCDIPTGLTANDTIKWGVATSSAISGTGVNSGSTFTASAANSGNAGFSGQMTLKSGGTFTVQKDSSSPGYGVKVGGSTGNVVGVLKFRATNEAINLSKIALQMSNSSASSSPSDLVAVSLWDGSTQVGSAVFTGTTRFATTTLSSAFVLPKDADKTMTIKVDLANIGTSQSGAQGAVIQVDYDGGDSTGTSGVGQESGTTINTSSTSDTAVDGFRYFKSVPTLAKDDLSATGVVDGRLMRFKVTADAKGDIGIGKFAFTISTTSAAVTNLNLFGFTDSSYSQPISGVSSGGQILFTNRASLPGSAMNVYPLSSSNASTTIQVPAGQTRYFELRGTVTPSATTYSVVTTLNGDTAYPNLTTALVASMGGALGSAVDYTGASTANFVWSANATTTATSADNDWSNGFGLPGFPSNGLIQARTN